MSYMKPRDREDFTEDSFFVCLFEVEFLFFSVCLSPLYSQAAERERLQEELEDAKDKARRRSIGNIKFIGELFKLKMLTEAIMHDCVVKLLKNHDEESLECLCRLLTTIGKDLDFEKAKVRQIRKLHVINFFLSHSFRLKRLLN